MPVAPPTFSVISGAQVRNVPTGKGQLADFSDGSSKPRHYG